MNYIYIYSSGGRSLIGLDIILYVLSADDEKKVGHLRRLEGARERLQLVRADLMEEGSFDDAILGCQGVFHTASPVLPHPSNSDPKVYMYVLFCTYKYIITIKCKC